MNEPTIYQNVIDRLREQLGFDFMALAMEDAPSGFSVRWRVASGNLNNRYRRIVLRSGRGIAGTVFKTGKPLLVPHVDPGRHVPIVLDYPIVNTEGLTSIAAVPLYDSGRVKGVLLGGYRGGRAEMTEALCLEMAAASASVPGFDGKELVSR
ncbi:nitrogen regulatory protein A [Bhargavaea beijingensis]|uniref:Nitrogen regulatory protein A n=1 Tax=Bhargavaea beijingensis TaxID=426756 RepID=A0A1G6XEI5_9BACL|nr:GAF domain-containing protein [Bhargavaea beijingensis]SDD75777.1 nitrogen regulatory protein A [Bhargavaea beijingensis]